MKPCYRFTVLLCCLMFCSCAQMEKLKMAEINEVCEKNIKDYNKLLRWREIENAGMLYVDRALRDDFVRIAEDIKKRGVTITDYRILTTECRAEKKTAEAVVEFDYYTMPSNRIKTLTYRQEWKYTDTEALKAWMLYSSLPGFE